MIPFVYFVAALLGAVIPNNSTPDAAPKTVQVRLIGGPIHYDFLLPLTAQTVDAFDRILHRHGAQGRDPSNMLLVGWGAREFYTTVGSYRNLSARAIWRGITGDTSVMRVDVVRVPKDYPTLVLDLTEAQFTALLQAMVGSFASWTPLDQQGFGNTDAFYPAKGRFHIGRTCNVWVGRMIRATGVKFGVWTPLPVSVRVSHRLYAPG